MTWIADPSFTPRHPFGPQTLPYGVVEINGMPVVAVRVGDHALPLRSLRDRLGPRLGDLVSASSLDPLLAEGRTAWSELRERLIEIVTAAAAPAGAELHALSDVTVRLPFTVADYVDFYSSRYHAENVGRILRPNSATLPPNWTHLPIGYHGRAGTVVVSGTDVMRPYGQYKTPSEQAPTFGPTQRLDIEAEVGFVCGGTVASQVRTSEVAEHVFGVAMVNDWSARDIQLWESHPLGPFLGKSFATSLGAWITPLEALATARVSVPRPPHPLLDYLVDDQPWGLDLRLEIEWNGTVVSRPMFTAMAWSCSQQLAHMTINGARVRPGDLFASGTVSGPAKRQRGCLLELTWGGTEPVTLDDGSSRTYLEDGDTVVITATAPGQGDSVVGLSEVAGTVIAAAPVGAPSAVEHGSP